MKNMLAHVYAILRVDYWFEDDKQSSSVSVKKVVWSVARARSEVARLNRLNAEKGCHYFWAQARLEEKGVGDEAPRDGDELKPPPPDASDTGKA